MKHSIRDQLEAAYTKSKNLEYKAEDWKTPEWQSIKQYDPKVAAQSGVDLTELK